MIHIYICICVLILVFNILEAGPEAWNLTASLAQPGPRPRTPWTPRVQGKGMELSAEAWESSWPPDKAKPTDFKTSGSKYVALLFERLHVAV